MEVKNNGVSIDAHGNFIYPEIKTEPPVTEETKAETKGAEVKTEENKTETVETKVETTPAAEAKTEPEKKVETEVTPAKEVQAEVNENEEFFEELTPDVITKKLDDYSSKNFGLSYSDALAYKNRDIDKIAETNDAQLVIEHMQLKAKGRLTETEIRAKMAKFDMLFIEKDEDYKEYVETNNITPQQELDIEAEYDGLLRDAIDEIKKTQALIDFTPVKFKAKKAEPTKPEEQPKKEDLEKALRDVSSAFLKTFNNEEITIKNEKGEELVKITVEATEADKNKTLEAVPLERWITPDGKFDPEKHTREIHRLENFDKYMKLSYQAGIDKGKKSEAMDVHNAIKEKSETLGELHATPQTTAGDVALKNLGVK